MPVNAQRLDYTKMLLQWQRLRDCMDGRDAILKAGAKYVPQLPGADADQNKAYRERGNYYNAVQRTVGGMNGSIFQTAPEVDMPETQKALLDDITLTDVAFETFASQIGEEVFLMGRYGVLIDMPLNPTEGDALDAGEMRPYCVGYEAEKIINWRTARSGGDEILTMVVLEEAVEVLNDDDPFTSKSVCQYRVVMLRDGVAVQQLWREKAGGTKDYEQWGDEIVLMRRGDALTFLPFIFIGALDSSPSVEKPPLLDLADVNLGHWRNSCDHEYGLHLVALPTPWVAGVKGAQDGPIKMGPSVRWELEVQGSAGMLEFTGQGLKAIVEAMEEKKKQMAALGARLLEDPSSTAETLGAVKLRHSGETASLKTVAQSLEQALTDILQIILWWDGADATPGETDCSVELNKEYLNIRATPQEIQVALTALQAGEISFETWYNLLQSGGWAREGIDAAAERLAIGADKTLAPEPAENPELSPPASA
jgi:hypothetical protein